MFRKLAIALTVLLCTAASADARPRGIKAVPAATGFNGGKSQVGVNFLQIANDFAMLNAFKGAQNWGWVDNTGQPNPDELSNDGYPLPGSAAFSHGGVYTVFYVPLQSERPGNYACKWDGISDLYVASSNTVLPSVTFTGSVTAGILTAGVPSATIQKGMQVSTLGGIIGDQITGSAGAAGTYFVSGLTTAASQPMTVTGGSKTGALSAGNRYVYSTTAYRTLIGFSAATQTPSNLQCFHVDDEAELDAGQVLGKKFSDNWAYMGNPGVIRFLDWGPGNSTNQTTWATRKPASYVFYQGHEMRPSLWGGVTTNVGDAYTAPITPSGWLGLVDKAQVIVRFNASATTDSATLTVDGNTKTIRDRVGDATSTGNNTRPLANRIALLTYDQTLNVWIKNGGDTADSHVGLNNGVPPEVMLQVATKLGAHPWITQPYLSADPITDYMSSAATMIRDTGPSWMIPRFEGVNELWNNAAAFYGTRYAWNKAFAYWGLSTAQHQWQGKAISLLGQSISQVFSDDRNKYWVVLGVQTATACSDGAPLCAVNGTSSSDQRLLSANWIASGPSQAGYSNAAGVGEAYRWVTHVAPANYVNGSMYRTLQELRDGFAYVVTNAGNPSAQLALANTYADSLNDLRIFYATRIGRWYTWAQGPWGGSISLPVTFYEGGWTPDYSQTNWTSGLVGATPGSPCTLNLPLTSNPASSTIAGNAAVIGMSVALSSVTGMTQLNGNTYTVNGVAGNSVTIDVDCSAFTPVPSSTVTLTIASPGVVNWTGHGLVQDQRVAFTTTGALPTGLTANINYFVRTVLDANSFTVSSGTVASGAGVVNFTGSQSGTHTANGGGLITWVNSPLYTNTLRYASKFAPNLQTQMTNSYADLAAIPSLFPSQFFLSGLSINIDNRTGGGVIGSSGTQVWGAYDESVYAIPYSPAVESIRQFNLNWLFKRDLDPASNDNDPMWLEKAA
jgi:hypothetical protein